MDKTAVWKECGDLPGGCRVHFSLFLLLRVDEVSGIAGKIVSVSKPIIYGLAIAYLLNPIVKAVDRRMLPLLRVDFQS